MSHLQNILIDDIKICLKLEFQRKENWFREERKKRKRFSEKRELVAIQSHTLICVGDPIYIIIYVTFSPSIAASVTIYRGMSGVTD